MWRMGETVQIHVRKAGRRKLKDIQSCSYCLCVLSQFSFFVHRGTWKSHAFTLALVDHLKLNVIVMNNAENRTLIQATHTGFLQTFIYNDCVPFKVLLMLFFFLSILTHCAFFTGSIPAVQGGSITKGIPGTRMHPDSSISYRGGSITQVSLVRGPC